MARVAKVAVDLEANSAKFTSGLARADKALAASGQRWKRTISDIESRMSAASNVIKGTLGAVAAGAAVRTLYGVNAEFQRLGASLKTVTGSTESAKAAMDMIRKFASETPYQLTEVTDAFIKLKAMGLDASVESLRSYGNTASAMGKNINQMIEAVADASTGEFERLKEFGIKARSEGDKVSFTFQGVTTTVGKNAAEITSYLKSIGEVQFAGAMGEQMSTLGGQVSNLKDNFDKLLTAIGEAGANELMSDALTAISEAAEAATDSVNEFVTVASKLQRINELLGEKETWWKLGKEDSWWRKVLYAPGDFIGWGLNPLLLEENKFTTSGRYIEALKKQKKELEDIIAKQKQSRKVELVPPPSAAKTSAGSVETSSTVSDKILKQIEQLQFQEAQLARTDREQAVYNALHTASIDINSKEGQAIAAAAGKLYDKQQAVEKAKQSQEELIKANEKELEEEIKQEEARTRLSSSIKREIGDNDKLIAALQVSEAEYERVAAMLELTNSYRQAGIELSSDEVAALEATSKKLGEQRTQMDSLKEKYKNLNNLGAEMGMTFSSAFEDAIVEGKKFSDMLQSLAQDILRLVTRMTITEPLTEGVTSLFKGLLGGLTGGGGSFLDFNSGFDLQGVSAGDWAGAFASGTRSAPPGMAWVGERGPELVKFRGGEQVYPASLSRAIDRAFRLPGFADGAYTLPALSAPDAFDGVEVNIINNAGADMKTQRRTVGGVDTIDVLVDQAVARKLSQRGSGSNKAIRQTFGASERLISR
jgi:phage tail tape-measure protein